MTDQPEPEQERPRINVPVPADLVPARETLSWGVVATVKAPLQTIARFAAWHLELGASEIHLYLDAPDRRTVRFFDPHPAIRLTRCNARYWKKKPEKPDLSTSYGRPLMRRGPTAGPGSTGWRILMSTNF